LADRFGGAANLDPIERERLQLAATLLLKAQHPRSQDDAVRLINSADRLIARVERSQQGARKRGRPSTFADALASRNAKP
jgi:hypothetical protein